MTPKKKEEKADIKGERKTMKNDTGEIKKKENKVGTGKDPNKRNRKY